jgi:hypothetical protein
LLILKLKKEGTLSLLKKILFKTLLTVDILQLIIIEQGV